MMMILCRFSFSGQRPRFQVTISMPIILWALKLHASLIQHCLIPIKSDYFEECGSVRIEEIPEINGTRIREEEEWILVYWFLQVSSRYDEN